MYRNGNNSKVDMYACTFYDNKNNNERFLGPHSKLSRITETRSVQRPTSRVFYAFA